MSRYLAELAGLRANPNRSAIEYVRMVHLARVTGSTIL